MVSIMRMVVYVLSLSFSLSLSLSPPLSLSLSHSLPPSLQASYRKLPRPSSKTLRRRSRLIRLKSSTPSDDPCATAQVLEARERGGR